MISKILINLEQTVVIYLFYTSSYVSIISNGTH